MMDTEEQQDAAFLCGQVYTLAEQLCGLLECNITHNSNVRKVN
jgi:hypothetical protein